MLTISYNFQRWVPLRFVVLFNVDQSFMRIPVPTHRDDAYSAYQKLRFGFCRFPVVTFFSQSIGEDSMHHTTELDTDSLREYFSRIEDRYSKRTGTHQKAVALKNIAESGDHHLRRGRRLEGTGPDRR